MGSGAPVAILAYLKEEVGLICNLFMFFCLRPFFRFLAFVLSTILVIVPYFAKVHFSCDCKLLSRCKDVIVDLSNRV